MKRIVTLPIILSLALSFTASAQQHVLSSVKKKINSLTLTTDVYKSALSTLKPALTHDDTKDQVETWYLQGKLQYGYYDKMVDSKAVGRKVDARTMGHALIDGYDASRRALSLDTIIETDKKGQAKVDKKTGRPKFKVKFSGEMARLIQSHLDDYNNVGGELYNVQDWDGALRAWDIYSNLSSQQRKGHVQLGQTRYFQALALWQKGDNRRAANYFALARKQGYTGKEAYDYALVCLSALDADAEIVALAREAYDRFGVSDVQYARILINDHINNKRLDEASQMLDQIIEVNDSDSEIFNLKGLVVEQQQGIAQALPLYKKCIELNPDNAMGQFNVGRYYYNEATTAGERYPRLSGRRLAEKANPLYREAMPFIERAYQLDPANQEARDALRNIYYRLGEARKLQQIEKKK